MEKKISVIIPTYNTEQYIKGCVESVLNQTYQNFEIIVVNDGSTDNTLKILDEIKSDKLEVITIKNSGQGYARNMALKKATGDYIMFLDSDDYIEPVTFEVAVKRIEQDNSDFVYFDYKYLKVENNELVYTSKEDFLSKKELNGEECIEVLKIPHYFTVNKLYRKQFLVENKCKYGEGYIYEDVEFWVKVATSAKKISLIHSPLYVIRTNGKSTTRSNHNTDRHVKGFINAFDNSIKLIKDDKAKYIFLNYMMQKFLIYYSKRTPGKLKKSFSEELYNRLKKYKLSKFDKNDKLIKLGIKLKAMNSLTKFRFYADIACKLKKNYKDTIKSLRNLKNYFTDKNEVYSRKYKNKKLDNILFMGFDYRYTGNSRYLYEKMLKEGYENLYFVTKSDLVNEERRIEPKSKKFYKMLYSSKIVIFESWIPKALVKPEDAIWINLWHGTPLKKMLYDSNEEEILITNPAHKRDKFKAIKKMDYLLLDNPSISKYFETSFLMSKEQLLGFGYPRVEYLIENKDNVELKTEIRKKLNVDENKKIIMYLPTWRDYNYGNSEEYDFAYFLDKVALEKELNDDKYVIISKDHAFLRKAKDVTVTDIETQELLLVSDFVITDYSSVMFDAFAIDIPVGIIAKDYEKYSKSRGLYEDMWKDLSDFTVTNEKDLAKLIKEYKINDKYKYVKEEYCYKSEGSISEFIKDKMKD